MKVIIKTVALACIVFASCTSEKNENTPSTENRSITENPLLAQVEDIEENFAPTYFYVNAASGLSLRASTNLKSKKILTLPYGSQVKHLSAPTHTSMTIEGVSGNMVEVEYQGATGFVFNGYLSDLAPPLQDESIEDYANRISTELVPVTVTRKANDKGAAYGQSTTIQLPAKGWNEAYAITKSLFDLPKSLHLDRSTASSPRIIENTNKRTKTLVDEVALERNTSNDIEKIVYTYALKSYGRTITIVKDTEGFTVTEVEISN